MPVTKTVLGLLLWGSDSQGSQRENKQWCSVVHESGK